ncbi:MAG: type II toxin-antitoxin system mRNA interferase toxin, RelE/StbE family [Candidatus Ratteibacteria bacterium]|nr:type II toxin-antitoxin system mRNA interferase toxin, RelE/StbE family [Candidatus Ratteibacteria bacterium]
MIKRIVIAEPLKKKLKRKKGVSKQIREKFYWCMDMLLENKNHPSLRNKKIEGVQDYWEFSVTMNYRCVYRREKDTAYLLELGKHEDVF